MPTENDKETIYKWVHPARNWGPKFDSIGVPLLEFKYGAKQMDKRKRPWSAERKAQHRKTMQAFRAKLQARKTKRHRPVKTAQDGAPKIVAPRGQVITIHEGKVTTWICRYRGPELLVLTPA